MMSKRIISFILIIFIIGGSGILLYDVSITRPLKNIDVSVDNTMIIYPNVVSITFSIGNIENNDNTKFDAEYNFIMNVLQENVSESVEFNDTITKKTIDIEITNETFGKCIENGNDITIFIDGILSYKSDRGFITRHKTFVLDNTIPYPKKADCNVIYHDNIYTYPFEITEYTINTSFSISIPIHNYTPKSHVEGGIYINITETEHERNNLPLGYNKLQNISFDFNNTNMLNGMVSDTFEVNDVNTTIYDILNYRIYYSNDENSKTPEPILYFIANVTFGEYEIKNIFIKITPSVTLY